MGRRISFVLKMIGMGAWLGAAGLCHSETISHWVSGNTEEWRIDSPTVNAPGWRNYAGQIVFRPLDTVYVSAGGCVQTGGRGLTWKRYVDPQGPNSGTLYHGSFAIPGVNGGFLQTLLSPTAPGSDTYQARFTINSIDDQLDTLWLAYSDDAYGDNGYYSHDNGTGNQCENIGNAWVYLVIIHD